MRIGRTADYASLYGLDVLMVSFVWNATKQLRKVFMRAFAVTYDCGPMQAGNDYELRGSVWVVGIRGSFTRSLVMQFSAPALQLAWTPQRLSAPLPFSSSVNPIEPLRPGKETLLPDGHLFVTFPAPACMQELLSIANQRRLRY